MSTLAEVYARPFNLVFTPEEYPHNLEDLTRYFYGSGYEADPPKGTPEEEVSLRLARAKASRMPYPTRYQDGVVLFIADFLPTPFDGTPAQTESLVSVLVTAGEHTPYRALIAVIDHSALADEDEERDRAYEDFHNVRVACEEAGFCLIDVIFRGLPDDNGTKEGLLSARCVNATMDMHPGLFSDARRFAFDDTRIEQIDEPQRWLTGA